MQCLLQYVVIYKCRTDSVVFWQVLRAADPALIHVYHDKFCDAALPSDQTRMCLATAAESLGFKQVLGRLVLATHGFNITSIT